MKIAIITYGGINSGHQGLGVPSLMAMIKGLNEIVDLTVYTFAKPNIKNELNVIYIPGNKVLQAIGISALLFKSHLSKKYDVIQAFWGFPAGWLATLLGKLFSIHSVVTLMGGETASLKAQGYGMLRNEKGISRVKKLFNRATSIVYLSTSQINQLQDKGFTNFDTFKKIPFGVKVQNKEGLNITKQKNTFQLLVASNINPVKDHKTIIDAFKKVLSEISVRLIIAGGDFMNGEIKRYVEQMQLLEHVSFTGQLSNDDILKQMANSDLMLIGSLSEGQNVVFCEAMSVGLPVCSTDVGLMRELNSISCITSEVSNSTELANNAIKLLKNQSLYRALSNGGLKWTKENDIKLTVVRYVNHYKKLVANNNS